MQVSSEGHPPAQLQRKTNRFISLGEHARIQEIFPGGVQAYNFQRYQRGPTFSRDGPSLSRGWVQLFQKVV